MRKPAFILICLGLIIGLNGNTQQVYQFSQYLQNLYILNSATAGMNDYFDVSMSYRKQWVGIQNSPSTYYLSANTALGKKFKVDAKESSMRISSPNTYDKQRRKSFHALGGYVANDVYGAFSLTMAGVSYAFHLPLSKKLTISFSPSVSYTSARFNQDKAQVELEGDPTYARYVSQNAQSQMMDVNFAFWLYHERFFLGYSSDQLMQDRLRLSDQISFEKIRASHNIIAGYKIPVRSALVITPSVMLRYNTLTPLGYDANLRFDYQDRYWGGLSYKSGDHVVAMAGLYISNTIRVGYSFDYAFATLNQYQNIGTHEIMIGLNLFSKEKAVF